MHVPKCQPKRSLGQNLEIYPAKQPTCQVRVIRHKIIHCKQNGTQQESLRSCSVVSRRRQQQQQQQSVVANLQVMPFQQEEEEEAAQVCVPYPKQTQQYLEILLLCNAFNSLSQKAYLVMTKLGHHVIIKEYESEHDLLSTVALQAPDLIVCPFLTKFIPQKIYSTMPCWIIHPGIHGDRGGSSIDWALKEGRLEWGCTILQASEEADAGDVWSSIKLPIQRLEPSTLKKSSLYRNEVAQAAMIALKHALQMYSNGGKAIPLDYNNPSVQGCFKPIMKQVDRTIDWNTSAHQVAYDICRSDSQPGVKEELLGETYFLYNAWVEEISDTDFPFTQPKTVIGYRDEAILIKCGQGAVWVTHLKQASKGGMKFFKLPATRCLPDSVVSSLMKLPSASLENPHMFMFPQTFQEVWVTTDGDVAYVFFEFYNGAMNTEQCMKLTQTLKMVRERDDINVVVLMGGYDFFSNGIHLNTIEASTDPENESWRNINAIDDVVREILLMATKLTITAFRGNAGAGGVMMGLAADIVIGHKNVVLNPSYQGMNLYGSEYWTFNLPRRIGHEMARRFTRSTLPLSAKEAYSCGLMDFLIAENVEHFQNCLLEEVRKIVKDQKVQQILKEKEIRKHPSFEQTLHQCRQHELAIMKKDFTNPKYHSARKAFVYKSKNFLCNQVLPAELA